MWNNDRNWINIGVNFVLKNEIFMEIETSEIHHKRWNTCRILSVIFYSMWFTSCYLRSGKASQKLLYASPPIQKLHSHSDITSQLYKPAFYSSHLSRNTSYSGTATIWVFCLPQQRYSYSTWSFMMELLLSVSQHWNTKHLL